MKKQKTLLVILTGLLALALILISCATTAAVQTERPPVWNTLGIKRIAIMPFATTYNTTLQRHAAGLLTKTSRSRIQAIKRFSLIDSAEISRVRAAKGNVENYADALFSGQVISAASQDSRDWNSRRDKDGNIVRYTTYKRDVQLSFNFTLTRTSDLQVLGTETMNFSNSYSSEDPRSLKSEEAAMQEMIQKSMAGIARYLAPYPVTEQLKFERVSIKDKAIKKRVKNAYSLVKKGNYKSAEEAFLGIYRETGIFEAAYNAGLLIELQGNLKEAAMFMRSLHNKTGNQKAALSLARLEKEIENAVLLDAYAGNRALSPN